MTMTMNSYNNKVREVSGLKALNITIVMIFLSLSITFISFLFHVGDADKIGRDFAFQNLLFTFFASTLLIFMVIGRLYRVEISYYGNWFKFGIQLAALSGIVLGIDIFVIAFTRITRYQVTDLELYLFYYNAAICEEMFFRGFIATLLLIFFKSFNQGKKRNEDSSIFNKINVGIISGFIFSIFHYGVYGENFIMLLSTFLAGTAFGLFYAFTENLLLSMISHAFHNLIVTGANISRMAILPGTSMNVESLVSLYISTIFLIMAGILILYKCLKLKQKGRLFNIGYFILSIGIIGLIAILIIGNWDSLIALWIQEYQYEMNVTINPLVFLWIIVPEISTIIIYKSYRSYQKIQMKKHESKNQD